MDEVLRKRQGTLEGTERRAAPRVRRGLPTRVMGAMFVALAAPMIASCVYYEEVPVHQPGPSKFDRSWEAARAAAEDVGITITDVDRTRGTIQGYKNVAD